MFSPSAQVLTLCSLYWTVFLAAFTALAPRTRHRALLLPLRTAAPAADAEAEAEADAADHARALEKATQVMTTFTNKYTANTGTYLCEDKGIPAVVIKGLAEHKVALGASLCPCRFYEDKEKVWRVVCVCMVVCYVWPVLLTCWCCGGTRRRRMVTGTVRACPCRNDTNAIACSFSPRITVSHTSALLVVF